MPKKFLQTFSVDSEKDRLRNKSLEYLAETPEYLDKSKVGSSQTNKKISITKIHFVKYFVGI